VIGKTKLVPEVKMALFPAIMMTDPRPKLLLDAAANEDRIGMVMRTLFLMPRQ
jgi:hypothetical protein